jgi:hypothetical protein
VSLELNELQRQFISTLNDDLVRKKSLPKEEYDWQEETQLGSSRKVPALVLRVRAFRRGMMEPCSRFPGDRNRVSTVLKLG